MAPERPSEQVSKGAGVRGSMDGESRKWLEALGSDGQQREAALDSLHDLLLAAASREAQRRARTGTAAAEAATAAVAAISTELDSYRGDSRFTTWAYKYVMFALSAADGLQFWRARSWPAGHEDWSQFRLHAGGTAEQGGGPELMAAVRRAVDEDLTANQRVVFTAVAFDDLPAEALTCGLGPSRNAIYQALFEARRKILARLTADGVRTATDAFKQGQDGNPWLDALLAADPGDTGCDLAFRALDRFAEAELLEQQPQRRFPGVAGHLASCAPCRLDYQGLMAEAGAAPVPGV